MVIYLSMMTRQDLSRTVTLSKLSQGFKQKHTLPQTYTCKGFSFTFCGIRLTTKNPKTTSTTTATKLPVIAPAEAELLLSLLLASVVPEPSSVKKYNGGEEHESGIVQRKRFQEDETKLRSETSHV